MPKNAKGVKKRDKNVMKNVTTKRIKNGYKKHDKMVHKRAITKK